MSAEGADAPAPGSLRARMASGRPLVGSICNVPNSYAAELMGRAGFDFLALDFQHAPMGRETFVDMLRALELAGTPVVVRPPWNQPELIGWALDAGAETIVAPLVDSVADAERFVAACKYPPEGERSYGPFRSPGWNLGYDLEEANRAVVCGVTIETRAGFEQVDQIAQVPGIDFIGIGQSDLSLAFGLDPSAARDHPDHHARVEAILAAAHRHGKRASIHTNSVDNARHWRSKGFDLVSVLHAAGFIRSSAAAVVAELADPPHV